MSRQHIRFSRGDLTRAALTLALAAIPAVGVAEKFVHLGVQPDGSEVFVQEAPASVRRDGKLQGWFLTVPATAAPITDEFGFERHYRDMLALNIADCFNRRMGVAMMTYRDDKGAAVARFDTAAGAIEFREIKPGTLGESMFAWLCAPQPAPTPQRSPRSATPPSAAKQSPFR